MNEIFEPKAESVALAPLIAAIGKLLREKGMEATQHQLSNENKNGALPSIDPTALVNVIPSNPTGIFMCCNLAIAIAHGSRGRGGLGQVIQQLRRHLICCADAQKGLSTKTVLIIYDKEDKRVFWESRRDFQAHILRNGVSFIRLHWDGKQLIEKAIMK
jgi:triphosphoribosyl-dephospho-CoA synthetase